MKYKLKKFMAALFIMAGILVIPMPALAEEIDEKVLVTEYGMVVDSFQGVDANYIPGVYNSNTGPFCCAAYVIKFYKTLYGVNTYNVNLVQGKPTVVLEGHEVYLEEVTDPQPGDMMQNLTYSHVAIVKRVEDDQAVLIEQNCKWNENGQTVAAYERKVGLNEAHFYRLVIDGEEKVFAEEPQTGEDVIKSIRIQSPNTVSAKNRI